MLTDNLVKEKLSLSYMNIISPCVDFLWKDQKTIWIVLM